MAASIETFDLSVRFRGAREVRALDGLNLRVEAGSVFGFLGLNGAGKTTAMHVLLGFLTPTEGRAELFGVDVRESIARRRIGYLPEQPQLYPFLTGREMLRLAGGLFGLARRDIEARSGDLLNTLDLTAAADRRVATYSRGMLQRLGLAQALINDPDLVILDEPTGGLDPLGRAAVRGVIEGLRAQGKTVFFSSHELSEVELVCDRLGIVARGRMVAEGRAADLVPAGERLESWFLRTVSAATAEVTP